MTVSSLWLFALILKDWDFNLLKAIMQRRYIIWNPT